MNRRSLPPERAGALLRWVRAGLVAAATLGVAAWAHASADGNLPGTAGLIAVWVLATAGAAGLLARPASYARIVGMVVAGQFALHLILSLVAGHGPAPAPSETARHYATTSMLADPGMGVAHHPAGGLAAETGGLRPLVAELTSAEGLRMTAAHLLAAGLVGVWLATGERVLWACLRRIAYAASAGLSDVLRRILLAWPLTLRPQPPLGRRAYVLAVDLREVDWLTATPRRGPPGSAHR